MNYGKNAYIKNSDLTKQVNKQINRKTKLLTKCKLMNEEANELCTND